MTQEHPITPPPELVDQWFEASVLEGRITYDEYNFANLAARWGADQELEACCDLLLQQGAWPWPEEVATLRTARRPKPLTMKEQALDAWIRLRNEASCKELDGDLDCLLRALESLPD